jgi:hypothetical protein
MPVTNTIKTVQLVCLNGFSFFMCLQSLTLELTGNVSDLALLK